jgi:hypothetical protein
MPVSSFRPVTAVLGAVHPQETAPNTSGSGVLSLVSLISALGHQCVPSPPFFAHTLLRCPRVVLRTAFCGPISNAVLCMVFSCSLLLAPTCPAVCSGEGLSMTRCFHGQASIHPEQSERFMVPHVCVLLCRMQPRPVSGGRCYPLAQRRRSRPSGSHRCGARPLRSCEMKSASEFVACAPSRWLL